MQPLQKLAQAVSGQLGMLHHDEGSGEREVLALEEQKTAEERGRERSDGQDDHHHGELEKTIAFSDLPEPHQPYARCGERYRIRHQRNDRTHADTAWTAEGVDTGGISPPSSPRCPLYKEQNDSAR